MNGYSKIVTKRAERRRTRLFAKLRYLNQEVEIRILDMSLTGAAIELSRPIGAGTGSRVSIEAGDIGVLHGFIRWAHNGRVGLQFDPNSNSQALVSSYFRFFHKDVRPVIGS